MAAAPWATSYREAPAGGPTRRGGSGEAFLPHGGRTGYLLMPR